MRKIARMTTYMLCAALMLAGCGSQKTGGGGSFSQKTESQALSKKSESRSSSKKSVSTSSSDAESAAPAENVKNDSISYNTIKYGGLLIPLHPDFTDADNNEKVLCYWDSSHGAAVAAYKESITWTVNDTNFHNYFENTAIAGMDKNAVPQDEKKLKVDGCDAYTCNFSTDINSKLTKLHAITILSPTQEAVTICCYPITNAKYADYFNDLPNLIKKDNSNAITPAPTVAPTATPTPTATPAPTQAPTNNGQVTPELKAFLDSYEAFMDQYVEFMRKYQANPTNAQLISEYSTYIDKLSDFEKKANEYSAKEGEMSTADYNYYIDTMARISKKMISASLSS